MDNTETDKMRIDTARYFSDLSRNAGKTGFTISYTATQGNLDIDVEFKEFCFKYANNEYLAGIGQLLQIARHYSELQAVSEYIAILDDRISRIEDKLNGEKDGLQKEEPQKEIKTF